ncbi:hypothetical protein O6H91_19G084600 [Diphasiastrum complanatum]|uniref:Uncharacterized protein n=1 Tax=Diphasiastrum complanatum TaxID=34168 RepID=A0ACC2AY39_DIPCM|nr:hypothetical protein O6H91_19G084600 [Diphasiastrum complanatum]
MSIHHQFKCENLLICKQQNLLSKRLRRKWLPTLQAKSEICSPKNTSECPTIWLEPLNFHCSEPTDQQISVHSTIFGSELSSLSHAAAVVVSAVKFSYLQTTKPILQRTEKEMVTYSPS